MDRVLNPARSFQATLEQRERLDQIIEEVKRAKRHPSLRYRESFLDLTEMQMARVELVLRTIARRAQHRIATIVIRKYHQCGLASLCREIRER